jgi:hypothetical protein
MTDKEYEQKKRECWEEYKRENLDGEVQWRPISRYDVFCAAFDRAYALGKQEIKQETKQEIANHNRHFDNILKDGFRNERRLNIAAQMMQALVCAPLIPGVDPNPPAEYLAQTALRLADALIAEWRKD